VDECKPLHDGARGVGARRHRSAPRRSAAAVAAGAYTRITFQLNVSAFPGIVGAFRGYMGSVYEVTGGVRGCFGCVYVSETAQVELRSGRV